MASPSEMAALLSKSPTTVTLDESQRQAVLLAIAHLAIERPGWDWMLGEIAEQLQGRELFENFKILRATSDPLPAQ